MLAEFLAELAAERLLRTPIETHLEEYTARLARDLLDGAGRRLLAVDLVSVWRFAA